ncbi:MAG: RadC family protein [Gemmataceae bacterium]
MSQFFPMSDSPLMVRDGGRRRYRPATAEQILAAARQVIDQKMQRGTSLQSPADARSYLRVKLAGYDYEVFALLLLDVGHRLIEYVELFRGTIDGASVHPREVIRETLRVNAAAAIFAHNHPSGNPEPSHADQVITLRLRDALALIDVRTLDHVIVAGDKTTSLAERGLL